MRKTILRLLVLINFLNVININAQTVYFDNNTKLYGITNALGKDILKPSFSDMRIFQHGLALFQKDGKWGLVNEKGKIILKPTFTTEDECGVASESYITAAKNKTIDNTKLVSFQDDKTKLYGYKDLTGKIIIEAQYNYAFNFSEGLALAQKRSGYVFIDENNKEVIQVNPQWFWIEGAGGVFQNGLFEFKVEGNPKTYLLINKEGEVIKNMNQGVFPTFINR